MKSVMAAVLLAAAGCSSSAGDTDDPPQGQPPADRIDSGRYSATFAALSEFGELISDERAAYTYVSRSTFGFGTWTFAADATSSMTLLERTIDDLRNETPGARSAGQVRQISVRRGSPDTWSGNGLTLSRSNATAPDIAGIPRTWSFRNLYRFGVNWIDYSVQINVDTAGVITGFDTNGCTFSGSILPRQDALYDLTLTAALCGATALFIEDATYTGHAYVMQGPGVGNISLHLMGSNRAQDVGLELVVFAPWP